MFNGQRCKRVTMAPSGLSASPRMGSCMAQEVRTAQSNFGKHAESHMVCGGENFSGIAIMYSKNQDSFFPSCLISIIAGGSCVVFKNPTGCRA